MTKAESKAAATLILIIKKLQTKCPIEKEKIDIQIDEINGLIPKSKRKK